MKKMTTLTSSLLFLQQPETIEVGITYGLVTAEELEDAQHQFAAFISKLEEEWPSDKIKEYVVQKKRERYQSTARFIQKLELDNRDARVRGVSFKDRQSFTVKINIGHKVLKDLQKEGNDAKRHTYPVRQLVGPLDMQFIQEMGFEKWLNHNIIGYF